MKKLAFAVSIISMFILLIIMQFSTPKEITTSENLTNLQDNQKVFLSGKVVSEKIYSNQRILTLDNNITLYCACESTPTLKNKNISVLGIVDTFQKTKINVLKITWQ